MKELLHMSAQEINRSEILRQVQEGLLTQTQAARAMDLTDRQVRRLVVKYRQRGPAGLIHGLRGQPSNRQFDQACKAEALRIIREHYADFKPSFAAEKLAERHNLHISHETLRQLMTEAGLWQPKQRQAVHRNRRERRASFGEMAQFDGSLHDWFEGRGPKCTLLASRDDANNIVVAQFAEYEGTGPVMQFWWDYFNQFGKPNSIYLDRHSTYKVNHNSALDDPEMVSQFERAMQELGIEVIHAHSPQAKGRIENLFVTLQDRLVKELRLAGISTIPEANRFLREVFLPAFNERFRVPAAAPANLHWPVSPKEDLAQILSVQSMRLVNRDHTIRFQGHWFQLANVQPVLILPRTKVTVEERLDGSIRLRVRDSYLDYRRLDAQPKPESKRIQADPPKPRQGHKPAPDHPWRKFVITRKTNEAELPIGHF
ncbi:MAG TPA: ISNCY family transposase [Candidatus Saccharimonadia bacterium]